MGVRAAFAVSGGVLSLLCVLAAACSGAAPVSTSSMESSTTTTSLQPVSSLPPSPPTTTTPTSPMGLASVQCTASQLTLAQGEPVSEPTGQESILLVLTNHSANPCFMFGYPGIGLYDSHNQLLPFQYLRSGDQVVTDAKPMRVDLGAEISAFVMVNKYRCDFGYKAESALLRLIPPNQTQSLSLNVSGIRRDMGYCGPGDP